MLESAYFYFESKASPPHRRKTECDLPVHAGRVHNYVCNSGMNRLLLIDILYQRLGTYGHRFFLHNSLKCDDAPAEEVVVTKEPFAKLDCHISSSKSTAYISTFIVIDSLLPPHNERYLIKCIIYYCFVVCRRQLPPQWNFGVAGSEDREKLGNTRTVSNVH